MRKLILVLFAFLIIPLYANSQCTKDKYSGLS